MDEEDQIDYTASFYPGFTITCGKCGSQSVRIKNDMGWSEESGSFGSIDLLCDECGELTPIVEA